MKILGLDYGKARIGVALSDEKRCIAFPFKVLEASYTMSKTIDALLILTQGSSFSEVVIGLPLLMNGKDSPMTSEVRTFAKLLEERLQKPVILWDERLTSKEAEKRLIEGEVKRKNRGKFVDTMAATLILQSYLDTKNNS